MENPNCQNCGAEIAHISRRKQFGKCGHCGTLHNVSEWFARRLPPVMVEVVNHDDALDGLDYTNRFGNAGLGILFLVGGATALTFTFLPAMVGHNPSNFFWILRSVFIVTMIAGVSMGVMAVIGKGH